MPRLLQTGLVAAWVSETEEEGCGVTGAGGSPGQLGLPAGLGRKGQLVGEASTGNAGAAEPPPTRSAISAAEFRAEPAPPWHWPGVWG